MSGYIGNIPVPQATQTRQSFTATASQTTFNTAGYSPGYVDVFLNGVKLAPADYTATNGSDVVLAVGAASGDILETVAYEIFQVLDQDFSGDFTVDGSTFVVDSTNDRVGIGTSSPAYRLDVQGANAGTDCILRVKTTATQSYSDAYLHLETAGSGKTGIHFGDAADDNVGLLTYDHSDDSMFIRTNATERMRITSSGNVGIGVTPEAWNSNNTALQIGSAGSLFASTNNSFVGLAANAYFDATNSRYEYINADFATLYQQLDGAHIWSTAGSGTADTAITFSEAMRIDSSGNVGIGTSSLTGTLSVVDSTSTDTLYLESSDTARITLKDTSAYAQGTGPYIQFQGKDNAGTNRNFGQIFGISDTSNNGELDFKVRSSGSMISAMRIDSSGNLLVGKTSTSFGTAGIEARSGGTLWATASGTNAASFNRLSSDGAIAYFNKDTTTVGTIARASNAFQVIANAVSGTYNMLQLGASAQNQQTYYLQWDAHNGSFYSLNDNTHDVGAPSNRWDDIYATNGTIQTSDQNEKQQIASLTDAEITAAKAISKLFKTFKWNDSVAEKGDAARTHSGVIAQDVEQAMTDAGLNAGDYAFFISTTWWETQTEVPAVEADEENGVEAQEAYTRTDTYHTLEEAPEGATERNRKGIRYPQLLSFIGAATEQRLASIETRLDALEAN